MPRLLRFVLVLPFLVVLMAAAEKPKLQITSLPVLLEDHGQLRQVLRITGPADLTATLDGQALSAGRAGDGYVEFAIPRVDKPVTSEVIVRAAGQVLATESIQRAPVPQLTLYVTPHSHVDIGYTHPQPEIEKKQVQNLLTALDIIKQSRNRPEGARYRWTVEAAWTVDHFLQTQPPEQIAELKNALQAGEVAMDAAYCNVLTGLPREEELLHVYSSGQDLAHRLGVTLDTAMISDVPGYTWGVTVAMQHAGIKYFSIGPNFTDRIGTTLIAWQDKPFYWQTPDSSGRVLCWVSYMGYAFSHIKKSLSDDAVLEYLNHLQSIRYSYDVAYLRWSGVGDNAVPQPELVDSVDKWNQRYAWPKIALATVPQAMHALEASAGDKLPVVRGDWTPYWEDGAGSSALETGLNRATDERLTQAEAVAAIRHLTLPADLLDQAWKHAILYSEHTWGAWCSITEPENEQTLVQWKYKQAYAQKADQFSRQLLQEALHGAATSGQIQLFNTTDFARREVVVVDKELAAGVTSILDGRQTLPIQLLSTGELAVESPELPPRSAHALTLARSGNGHVDPQLDPAKVTDTTLENARIRVRLDPATGDIVELSRPGGPNLAKGALNTYLFVPAADFDRPQHSSSPEIRVVEKGPLLASILVTSQAPGCRQLTREYRLRAGADFVEITNTLDKLRAQVGTFPNSWPHATDPNNGKEAVHFAFPFNVPAGQVRLDTAFAVIRPELDQMPGACKNWFTLQRWADVSNDSEGVTLAPLDAPLLEVGGLTARLIGSCKGEEFWRKQVEPTQAIYSWALNNYWHTNYRAYQDGIIPFRYALRPHGGVFDKSQSDRFGKSVSQPVLVGTGN